LPAATLPRIDLALVARSHGWYDLPPFAWDAQARSLSFVALVRDAPLRVTARETREAIEVRWGGRAPVAAVLPLVRRVLDLDADLGAFHRACREHAGSGFGWIEERGAGRILRAPTLFEDAVKVLATTNCTWAATKGMVKNLIGIFGNGEAFPDAAFVAGLPEKRLKDEARLGYRAPFLAAFAGKVAAGKVDLARWEDRLRPAADVETQILAQPGFGPYAAATLCRLLGRHEKLGLDSWSRRVVVGLRFRGRKTKDARIERFYAPFGTHAGLAFWLDVTRDWHEAGESVWP
jgi:N-glycosylase/DNA lyase